MTDQETFPYGPGEGPEDYQAENKETESRGTALATRTDGVFDLQSLEAQLSFAEKMIQQRMVSETFKNPSQVVVAIQWAHSMNMNPVTMLRMCYVVNGRPCLWGDGPLGRVQAAGLIEDMEEFFVDEKYNKISIGNKNLDKEPRAAVCRIKRKGQGTWQEDYFSIEDLERSGINLKPKKKGGGEKEVWKAWKRLMMRYKARTLCLKSKFADVLSGVDIAEYHEHFSPEVAEAKPVESKIVQARTVESKLEEDLAG